MFTEEYKVRAEKVLEDRFKQTDLYQELLKGQCKLFLEYPETFEQLGDLISSVSLKFEVTLNTGAVKVVLEGVGGRN
jgi:hypothetical protein